MYSGDGRDEDNSSCKYVGIDIGGRGIDWGIGEGGSTPDDLAVPLECFVAEKLRSRGSGLAPDGAGFRFGDVWPGVPFVYEDIRALVVGVEVLREEKPGCL